MRKPGEHSAAVGQAVAERRTQMKLSQKQLGERIGKDASRVSRIEAGTSSITVDDLYELAGALGCSPRTLLP